MLSVIMFFVMGLGCGCTASLWFSRWTATVPETVSAINVVDGIVLPDPDDPRWEPVACPPNDKNKSCHLLCTHHRFKLGKIEVKSNCSNYWSGIRVANATLRFYENACVDPYYMAVKRAYIARHAQIAIEGPPNQKLLP